MIFQLKNNFSILVLTLFCAAVFSGCTANNTLSNAAANAPTGAPVNAQTNSPTTGVKAPPRVQINSGDKVGVAECDQYLEKYEACAKTKVPEPGRSAMLGSISEMRNSWITIAANPETRENLAKDCKQNQAATKQNLSGFACAW